MNVSELKPCEFDQWQDMQSNSNPTSKAQAVAIILGALGWAVEDSVQSNPLAGRKVRKKLTQGAPL